MKLGRFALVVAGLYLSIAGLAAPSLAFAEGGLTAGFPQGPLWLSKSSLVEGDSVQVSTPVYNSSASKLSGDAVFAVDDTTIGTAHFELAPGESKIVSVSWTSKAGTHTLKAHIENANDPGLKQTVTVAGNITGDITVAVAPAPPKAPIAQALADATSVLTSVTSAATPVVGTVASTVFEKTEELRKSAVVALQDSLNGTNSTSASTAEGSSGSVLGAETYRAPETGLAAAAITAPAASGFMRILKTILLFLVSYTWVFYPLLLLILLLILYTLGKAMSQKRRTA